MKYKLLLVSILFFIGCDDEISIVDSPDTKSRNSHYVSNRAPLQPSKLIKLPVGSVKPEGWLLEYFNRQKNGLTGNLGKISAWLDKKDNAWLSKSGEGKWGWEEVPYWLKGYANIGYITEDKEMIDEAKIWIESVLNSQREDGYFGPEPYV
ncbi:MAG: beta-L-arabinofuranosidase domain-containing protein, partial [Bacteroidota bacterium]|nr:beta-L-arabinofuranosidase domain-containing protein [Bacteroidota bacterium]